MASHFITSYSKIFLLLTIFSPLRLLFVSSFEFDVGESEGWIVPSSGDKQMYNEWASKNRFQIGDTIIFKYKKDSVMVVSEEEYNHCDSTHPTFFSNDGNTSVALDRSGLFYFISGVSGHCKKGQKMIIKVLGHPDSPEASPSPPGGATTSNGAGSFARVSLMDAMQLSMLVLGFLFVV